jgi:hypothetical protein
VDYTIGWPLAKAIPEGTEEAVAEFIFTEIYIYYDAPQEIFTDGGKNLWGGIVIVYLKKVATHHSGTSPYHPLINGRVERLNGILGGRLSKFLLGKPTKLWDLYLDKVIFACRVRIYTTNKTSPFYLVYGRHPHLLGDDNKALPSDTPVGSHEERFRMIQSARNDAVIVSFERVFKDKTSRDEII